MQSNWPRLYRFIENTAASKPSYRPSLRSSASLRKEHAKLRKLRDNLRQLFGKSSVALTGAQQVSLLRWLQQSDALTERDLHAVLSNFFAQREIDLAEPIIGDDSLGFEFLRKFYRLRLLDYKLDERATVEEIASLLERIGPIFPTWKDPDAVSAKGGHGRRHP